MKKRDDRPLAVGDYVRIANSESWHRMSGRIVALVGDHAAVVRIFGGHKTDDTVPLNRLSRWEKGAEIQRQHEAAHERRRGGRK